MRVAPRGGAVALPAPGGMALGLIDALAGVFRHRWLDRLIHGRAWIALVAFALIGIVAMQLWVVKLGVGIGRALEHEGLLQRENATLGIEDAQLSSGERVEQLAAARGMVVAAPGSLRFDTSRGALDARLAAAALAKGGQVEASGSTSSGSSTDTSTAASGTEAATSSTEAAAQSSGTATATGSTTSTETAENATAAGTPATATPTTVTASTPEGASESGAPATGTPAEGTGADAATGAATAGGGAAASEPAAAGTTAVGSDGGTQQTAPAG